jgi:glucan phosphorylase
MTEEQRKLDELTGKVSAQAEEKKDAVVETAKQLKERVTNTSQEVKDRAQSVLEEGKGKLTSSLDAVASTLGKTTESLQSNELGQLAPYGEKLQDWTQGLSDYLKNANASDLLRDAESLARRQPAVFLGGAFVVGLLAARFLKSSSGQASEQYASGMRYDSGTNYDSGARYE